MSVFNIEDDMWVIESDWAIKGKTSNKRVLLIEIYAGVLGMETILTRQSKYPVLGYSKNSVMTSKGTLHWQSQAYNNDKVVTSTQVVYAMKRIIKYRSNGKIL